MIEIRNAVPEDLKSIADLEAAVFSDAWSEHALEDSMHQEYVTVLTALECRESAEKVVGYLICYRMINEGNIVRIAVDPAVRRQGVGRRLMDAILEEGAQMGLTEYSLEVRVSNEPAIQLYTSYGFVSEGCRKRYYTDPIEDGYIMWRR